MTDKGLAYQIYPNPFKDYFIVQLEGKTKEVPLELYNAMGNLVFSSYVQAETRINMKKFPIGFYYCKIGKGLNMRIEKMVKL